jgi:hypothetical protein
LNVWQDNFDGFFDRPWEVLDEYMCVLFRGFGQWGGFDYVIVDLGRTRLSDVLAIDF